MFFEDKNNDGLILEDPTNPQGNEVLQRELYYPFGLQFRGTAPLTPGVKQQYLYNGKELDDTGLYAYGFRYYDPATGRFTGVDPIADQFASLSGFNYASNDPISKIDLHGLQGVNFAIGFVLSNERENGASERRLQEVQNGWVSGSNKGTAIFAAVVGGGYAISRNPQGALKGASVDVFAQLGVALAKGQTVKEAFSGIDVVDGYLSAVEGSLTNGLTTGHRVLLNAGSELIQAGADVKLDGTVDIIGTEGSDKTIEQVFSEGGIGVLAGYGGNAVEGLIDFSTNRKMRSEIPNMLIWSRRYMEGSEKRARVLSQITELNRTITGNTRAAQSYGKLTEETSKEVIINE